MQFQCNQLTTSSGAALSDIITSTATNVIRVSNGDAIVNSLVAVGTVDVATPAAVVMASATDITDGNPGLIFESTGHGFTTGLVGQFTTSNTLPTGISLATNYYVIVIDADFFMVATSLANALAGTAVDYTNAGTGDQTFTPTSVSASVRLEGSPNYEVVSASSALWVQCGSLTSNITADGSFTFELDYIRYPAYRLYFTVAAGLLDMTNVVITTRN